MAPGVWVGPLIGEEDEPIATFERPVDLPAESRERALITDERAETLTATAAENADIPDLNVLVEVADGPDCPGRGECVG